MCRQRQNYLIDDKIDAIERLFTIFLNNQILPYTIPARNEWIHCKYFPKRD